jgi:spore photoproduct lyase
MPFNNGGVFAVTRFVPSTIFVETGLDDSPVARRALAAAPDAGTEAFADLTRLLARIETLPFEEAKKMLVVAGRGGGFVKPFPTGPGNAASGWHYFIPAIGCPADCRYCFLMGYHAASAPVVFANQDAMLAEIEERSAALGGGYFYGGELCDNLMLEEILAVIGPLTNLFRRLPAATLELRTKSDDIAPLLAAGPAPNVIVSWTLSPAETAAKYEMGAAPVEARLKAARQAQQSGHRVALRCDPIILEGDWRGAYEGLFSAVSGALDPTRVDSVHLGCIRCTPTTRNIATSRFGSSAPFAGELVQGSAGKLSYPRPLRVAAYLELTRIISRWSRTIPIRLCMETPEVTADLRRLASNGAIAGRGARR